MMIGVEKLCGVCKTYLPLSDFNKNKRHKDGLHSWCRKCQQQYRQRYYQQNRNRELIYARKHGPQYRDTINGRLRQIYGDIKRRCNNPNVHNFSRYGGRGIKCSFQSSDEFVNYIINILRVNPKGLQIDRIDNNGHYEPGNIQFVTAKENANNRG